MADSMARIQLVFVDSPTPITRSFGFSLLANCSLCSMKIADRIFFFVSKSKSQEAFLSLILLTVVGMSVLTEGLGLNISLFSYAGSLEFGLTACRRLVPSMQNLIHLMEDALVELEALPPIKADK